ncbi:MAG TPA: ABC transporter ATP-binding protein [Acidimicrobiales bacterium]|jgi:NitT/TauT family transport system ATP-binding protein|nr:ABC transporter ATP-binding protein [Acidimicrobiales bacterium]
MTVATDVREAAPPATPAAAARGPVVCHCRDLTVELGSSEGPRRVLEGITADLREGELVSILGRSGTGKTTLLRVLGGLVDPAPGSQVGFRGQPLDGPPEEAAFVFQDYTASLLPWRTVEKNVALGLEGKASKGEIRRRVADALETVGLAERARDYPWRLSGGMQQRVQLARGLAMDARVLLMDEPFGALDAMTKASLQDELQRVHQQRKPTIAFVTHDVDEAVYLSDRILVLGGSPATIVRDIPVELPRPRDQLATKELPQFHRLRRIVFDEIRAHHG